MAFIREDGDRNVFDFACPVCKARGEIGIPKTRAGLTRHECGTLIKHDPGYPGRRRPSIQVFIPGEIACYGTVQAERAGRTSD